VASRGRRPYPTSLSWTRPSTWPGPSQSTPRINRLLCLKFILRRPQSMH
jgi:hypothetical protein